MKKILLTIALSLFVVQIFSQDLYMYINGNRHLFNISASKILVKSKIIDTTSIKNAYPIIQNFTNINKNGLKIVSLQNSNKATTLNLLSHLKSSQNIIYTSPVLLNSAGKEIGALTNQILVRLKTNTDYSLLLRHLNSFDVEKISLCVFDNKTYLITLGKTNEGNSMQIANQLFETDMFEYAEPNLIHFVELFSNDQLFSQQWALQNTGQSGGMTGIDINATQAWSITTGSPDTKVAVIDVGIELDHADLVNNLLPGFDATGNNSAGAPINNFILSAHHGTACASIIAAQADNTIGIAGIAYNSKIMPITMTTRDFWNTTESYNIATAIDWARENGASVISLSLDCYEVNAVNIEIEQAVTEGRNNKGCVIVAATGNIDVAMVSYPAWHTNVMAVGAIDRNGYRADFSNYGIDLDVVAPGVDIYVADLQDTLGKNTANGSAGDYYANFSGTSAACPYVAGIAALILSVNPYLTSQQVRNIIESTAQKIGNYNYQIYPNRPNGTWHEEMGYGLIDAYAAVVAACFGSNISNQTITDNQTINSCCDVEISNTSIESGANVVVTSNSQIRLLTGFHAKAGSHFHAKIESCNTGSSSSPSLVKGNNSYFSENNNAENDEKNITETPKQTTSDKNLYYHNNTIYNTENQIFTLYNIFGSAILTSKETAVNVSNLISGVYIVKTEKGKVLKFVR